MMESTGKREAVYVGKSQAVIRWKISMRERH